MPVAFGVLARFESGEPVAFDVRTVVEYGELEAFDVQPVPVHRSPVATLKIKLNLQGRSDAAASLSSFWALFASALGNA